MKPENCREYEVDDKLTSDGGLDGVTKSPGEGGRLELAVVFLAAGDFSDGCPSRA